MADINHMGLPNQRVRVRKPSERIRMMTSFSNFKNTTNDPVLKYIEPETPVEIKPSIREIDGSTSVQIITNPKKDAEGGNTISASVSATNENINDSARPCK